MLCYQLYYRRSVTMLSTIHNSLIVIHSFPPLMEMNDRLAQSYKPSHKSIKWNTKVLYKLIEITCSAGFLQVHDSGKYIR